MTLPRVVRRDYQSIQIPAHQTPLVAFSHLAAELLQHIIRSQDELERTHLYTEANPAQWVMDRGNPDEKPL
jgi:hypothetical protein